MYKRDVYIYIHSIIIVKRHIKCQIWSAEQSLEEGFLFLWRLCVHGRPADWVRHLQPQHAAHTRTLRQLL